MGDQGRADPQRLAIMGGSAGGYTTLRALTTTRTFHAGISLFGVGDLEALVRDTHKFESRYLDGLVGPYPQERAGHGAAGLARLALRDRDRKVGLPEECWSS